jgi:glucosyl-3-phosphoglycerate phosphatase
VSSAAHRVELTLVRHGESDWNDQNVIQGQNDTARLTALGRHQARAVAAGLRGTIFDRVISSDLVRAKETATIIAEKLGLELEVEPLLRERCFGVFEGGPSSDLTSENTGIEHEVLINPEATPPQGESFRDVVTRADKFLQRVNKRWPNERLLVVTHGGMIRALRAHRASTELKNMEWYPVGNCSVWTLAEPEDS